MHLISRFFQANQRLLQAAQSNPSIQIFEKDRVTVRLIQMALVALGYPMPLSMKPSGSMDGIFGTETLAAVKSFQRDNYLGVDGAIGKNTMGVLDQKSAFLPEAPTDLEANKTLLPTTYYIPRPVSRLRQPDEAACWATTATILFKYKNPDVFDQYIEQWPAHEQIEFVLTKAGEKLTDRPKDFFVTEFRRRKGLKTINNTLLFCQCLNLNKVDSSMARFFDPFNAFKGAPAWAALLRWAKGPLAANVLNAVAGMAHLYNHWILITGVDLVNTMAQDRYAPAPQYPWESLPFFRIGIIHYFDPWTGGMHIMSARDLDYLVGPLPQWADSGDQYRTRIFF